MNLRSAAGDAVFPTLVGMNRNRRHVQGRSGGVPHARGDEPKRSMMSQRVSRCSPLSDTLASYCPSGSRNLKRLDGGVACDLSLWLSHDGVVSSVPGRPAEMQSIVQATGNWLVGTLGPWWLLGAGALGVLVVRKAARGLTEVPVVGWLLDLPSKMAVVAEE